MEALAVVGVVKEFYPYFCGFKFKLITDHNPLIFLKDLKDVGDHLMWWMLYLQLVLQDTAISYARYIIFNQSWGCYIKIVTSYLLLVTF